MGKIYCLLGKSASGKDTIYQELINMQELSLKEVILYTTRPIRTGEADGITYHFITEEEVPELYHSGKVIESRTYETAFGPWRYFTIDDGQIDLFTSNYLIIGTLESFLDIRSYFGRDRVVGIYIWLDDGVRLSRALERERKQKHPKYSELCRRYLADENDFSDIKVKEARVDFKVENTELDVVLENIKTLIKGEY